MHNHEPKNYKCPICLGIKGIENEDTMIRNTDIFYQDDLVTGFISSFFVGNNPGQPIIVPNEHYENLYDLPDKYLERISTVSKKVAVALREVRQCEGVTVIQNNEPVGNQHAFHYHLHLFPRFLNDELHKNMLFSTRPTAEERLPYSLPLKEYFKKHHA